MEALFLGLIINVLREFQSVKLIHFFGDRMVVRDLRGLEWEIKISQVISEKSCLDKNTLTFNDLEKEWKI